MSLDRLDTAGPPTGKVNGYPFPVISFCLLLVGAIFAIYWQVAGHQFLIYDDRTYVAENGQVLQGLTLENVRWAFSTFHDANWFPLTWLSHMLDVQLFGRNPAGHHLVNVGLHALNALLCFRILSRLTGSPWSSAVVAAIFALHPLRVESVAWVAERKDVLSALFWFLTLNAYVTYGRQRSFRTYLPVCVWLICGLLAKPMLVTLPFLLLLLDYWPLGRLAGASPSPAGGQPCPQVGIGRAIAEKLPLMLLVSASSVVTFIAQRRGGTVSSFDHETTVANLANAVYSYLVYLGKLVCPVNLAVFYPFDDDGIILKALLALPVLVGITFFVVRQGRRRPYLPVGWFWYLGTMVPVIGIVKVGAHAYADRYTYIPLIGITMMLVWGGEDLSRQWRQRVLVQGVAVALLLLTCAGITWRQLGFWRDSSTLFTRALAVTEKNWLAHNNLSTELIRWGRFDEAYDHITAALRYREDYASAFINKGIVHKTWRENDQAIDAFQRAIEYDPAASGAYFNLGGALLERGDIGGAYVQYRQLLVLDPPQADALLGMIRFAESRSQGGR